MGFVRYLSFTLHIEAGSRGLLNHYAGIKHWPSWISYALEYLAQQVPTPCITTAQWAQLLARFGPIHKSFTEMLPPMVWLGSQLYVSGFLCKISCIDVVR